MKVLTTQEMKRLDQFTCERRGISSLELMEIAGQKIYDCIVKEKKIDPERDFITIVSGTGNNGGDSLVVARHFLQAGYKNLKIIVVGNSGHLTGETNANLERLKKLKANIYYFEEEFFYQEYKKIIEQSTIIIEGIFGIGLNRDIEGIRFQAINSINHSGAYVISIDIPSGIRGDNGRIAGIAIKADFTVVVHTYKIGNLLNDAKDTHGKCRVVDIGIIERGGIPYRSVLQEKDVKGKLKKRKYNSHKYDYGAVLTIGGSIGMTGAPCMSAYGALRTGSGLSSIAAHEECTSYMQNIHPEIMIKPYGNKKDIEEAMHKKSAIAFGPGLGRKDDFNFSILEQLLQRNIPIIIDADGLYYLKAALNKIREEHQIIITPHYGEMAMLLDTDSESIGKDPLGATRKIVENYNITLLLKGTTTIIAQRDEMYFHTFGNPGMATAGSGDVLTGIILSLAGQGFTPLESCRIGAYLHSLAGDYAAEEIGEYSMIATDIIKFLPKAIKTLIEA